MSRFRKKPVAIEATQWFKNGDHPEDFAKDTEGLENGALRTFTGAERKANDWEGEVVRYFRRPDVSGHDSCRHCGLTMHVHGWIDTKEGGHIVCPGDWVITGVAGERYPCKPAIFDATYEDAAAPIVPFNDDTREILGMVCFRAGPIAHVLKAAGRDIPPKAEAEQAAVIHWLLELYLQHGDGWRNIANAELSRAGEVARA